MYGGYRVLQGRLRVNTPNSLVVRYIASFGLGTLLWVESHRFLKTSRAPVHPVPVPRVDRGGCELDVWNYNIPCGLAGGVLGIFSCTFARSIRHSFCMTRVWVTISNLLNNATNSSASKLGT